MDNKALYSLSYGVFLLGTKDGEKVNACITNTCFQTANAPTRIAISVIKQNLTCEMIEKSGVFTLSILSSNCSFETIKRFGYQSGRSINKFEGFEYETAANGCPYITKEVCSIIEAKVCNQLDLGSHMLFVAEVTEAKVINDTIPLTYADYQNKVKPKSVNNSGNTAGPEKKIKGWRCKICGYEYSGAELAANFECPICGHPADDFEPIFE